MSKLPELLPDAQNINPKGLKGLWIPEEILFHPDLTPAERILLSFIYHLDTTENHCYATNGYLGDLCGRVTAKSVESAVSRMRKKGFIELVSYDGRIRKMKVNLEKLR